MSQRQRQVLERRYKIQKYSHNSGNAQLSSSSHFPLLLLPLLRCFALSNSKNRKTSFVLFLNFLVAYLLYFLYPVQHHIFCSSWDFFTSILPSSTVLVNQFPPSLGQSSSFVSSLLYWALIAPLSPVATPPRLFYNPFQLILTGLSIATFTTLRASPFISFQ